MAYRSVLIKTIQCYVHLRFSNPNRRSNRNVLRKARTQIIKYIKHIFFSVHPFSSCRSQYHRMYVHVQDRLNDGERRVRINSFSATHACLQRRRRGAHTRLRNVSFHANRSDFGEHGRRYTNMMLPSPQRIEARHRHRHTQHARTILVSVCMFVG